MREDAVFVFGSFRLDVANASLRRGKQPVFLTPKALNVLRHLLVHAGQLVTRDDLWRAVWPEVTVTDGALTVCVSEIRKALQDEPKTPCYIETVHRRGYRFIAPVSSQPPRISDSGLRSPASSLAHRRYAHTAHFVGREEESSRLRGWLERALGGERQIVFVTGEPGIGKTALVEEFLRQEQISPEESLSIGRGQCVEHYGIGEAYLPVLDALGRLFREPKGGRLVEILDTHAPAWLAPMPALLGMTERRDFEDRAQGATHGLMLRQLTDAIEAISRETPLILRLEDLHWSDYSTLEWLGFLARRNEPARLLVIGTYRPVEVIVREHPLRDLKHELQIHGQCRELPLSLLSEAAVMKYLTLRFASSSNSSSGQDRGKDFAPESLRDLAHKVYRRTDGNPLFMVNLVDYFAEREVLKTSDDRNAAQSGGALVADGLVTPPNLIQMIERNLDRLNPQEQVVLEAASVAGAEFPAAAVAAAVEQPISEIESCCTGLSRQQQFVRPQGSGEWPDGTVAATFQFLHGLYRDVLYERLPPGRRAELHRRIAEREETAWGARAAEIATELAHHFRRAGNTEHAIGYLELAGKHARLRNAFREALENYQQALTVLNLLPPSADRDLRELKLRKLIADMLVLTKGNTAPETIDAIECALDLARRCGDSGRTTRFMVNRAGQAYDAGDPAAATAIADESLEMALRQGDLRTLELLYYIQLLARHAVGDFAGSERYFAAWLKLFENPIVQPSPSMAAAVFGAASMNAWVTGRIDTARQRETQMMALGSRLGPYDGAFGPAYASKLRVFMQEYEQAEALAVRALKLTEQYQLAMPGQISWCLLGHCRAQLGRLTEGIELIRRGIDGMLKSGQGIQLPECAAWLAQALGRQGDIVGALNTVEQALRSPVVRYRPEVLRIRGELRLQQGSAELAEADFREAVVLARNMGAKSLELRTTLSLEPLLMRDGRTDEARSMLTGIYNSFTEGFDTADLKEAKLLLDELCRI